MHATCVGLKRQPLSGTEDTDYKMRTLIPTHDVPLASFALRTHLGLLVQQALGLAQHLLHLGQLGGLGVAGPADQQQLFLPLAQLAAALVHVCRQLPDTHTGEHTHAAAQMRLNGCPEQVSAG